MSIRARIEAREGIFAIRPNLYIFVVLSVILAASVYKLWSESIFPCSPNGYDSDHYLGYCQAEGYGDYEHGAFWFGLEPTALNFAKRADVLFLGESKLQYAFSTTATSDWFGSASSSYYLMGFLSQENFIFAGELLRKLTPQAKVYVINLDSFFERSETPPARVVMRDENARNRYEEKRRWQDVHQSICKNFSAICGGQYAVFRSRQTGAYSALGGLDRIWFEASVSYDGAIDQTVTKDYTATGADFLSHLPVKSDCIIFTMVPSVATHIGTAKAIATNLGINFVAPELDGLRTFDRAHLDRPSAERWSAAFFLAATPQILKCLNKPTTSLSTFLPRGPLPTGTPGRP
jgi:hypothetical protein